MRERRASRALRIGSTRALISSSISSFRLNDSAARFFRPSAFRARMSEISGYLLSFECRFISASIECYQLPVPHRVSSSTILPVPSSRPKRTDRSLLSILESEAMPSPLSARFLCVTLSEAEGPRIFYGARHTDPMPIHHHRPRPAPMSTVVHRTQIRSVQPYAMLPATIV